jgi:hypothetical protein
MLQTDADTAWLRNQAWGDPPRSTQTPPNEFIHLKHVFYLIQIGGLKVQRRGMRESSRKAHKEDLVKVYLREFVPALKVLLVIKLPIFPVALLPIIIILLLLFILPIVIKVPMPIALFVLIMFLLIILPVTRRSSVKILAALGLRQ